MNLTLVFAAAFVVTLCGLVVVTAGLRQSERDRTRLLAANARLAATVPHCTLRLVPEQRQAGEGS